MIFYFKVSGDSLELIRVKEKAFSGNVNSYICKFEFDSEWDGMQSFATFGTQDEYFTVTVDTSCEAIIPSEVLKSGNAFTVGLFGTTGANDDFKRISTGFEEIAIREGAYKEDATAPEVPTPDVWEELINRNIPKIGDNGNWYIWDVSSGEYRDSGVSAIPDGAEEKVNKVTEITASSTDEEYPSAKAVYELVGDIESVLADTVSMQSDIIGDPTMPLSEVNGI